MLSTPCADSREWARRPLLPLKKKKKRTSLGKKKEDREGRDERKNRDGRFRKVIIHDQIDSNFMFRYLKISQFFPLRTPLPPPRSKILDPPTEMTGPVYL